ncbi:MAG TPA: diacylglycerol kinase family protein [Chitinophagaceae bacterium]|nr:diacylglycerol kinase family protein [Chitinophagaceae bacterium]
MKPKTFSLRKRANSFRFAWDGIRRFFAQEHNSWIHLAATVAIFFAAKWFQLSRMEIISLVIVTGFVWSAEIFNTAIEKVMDFISPQQSNEVKYIKDLSAAAVLIASFIALVTGAFIFIPKIF